MVQEASRPASRVDLVRALREAAITALIAFGMFLPLIGFNTVQNIHNELVLETRWPLLAALVGILAVGRFLYALLMAPWLARRAMRPRKQHGESTVWRARFGRWLIPFTLGFAVVYPPLALSVVGFQGAVKWIDNFGVQILIYVMLGWGLNIVVGPRGSARSRLCRLLRRRSLFLRAARKDLRLVVLAPAAARGLPGGVLGHPARISSAAAARRLSRHRDARVRRDHPTCPDQLGPGDQRLCRHQQHPAAHVLRHSVQRVR